MTLPKDYREFIISRRIYRYRIDGINFFGRADALAYLRACWKDDAAAESYIASLQELQSGQGEPWIESENWTN